jgi:hypothetical protein
MIIYWKTNKVGEHGIEFDVNGGSQDECLKKI